MGLSDRVWKVAEQARGHIELSLGNALGKGTPAPELARIIKQDLLNPDKLFRRVRDENGILRLSKNARNYHPGQGVYRSSYKNALRVARTEVNMAYRSADHDRWQGEDFVTGIRISLSNNHTLNGRPFVDICDDLQGVYPKTFKFTGWHPQCRCIATPVMEDSTAYFQRLLNGGEAPDQIKDTPKAFKDWLRDNEDRIQGAKARGTLPYWIRDNGGIINGLLKRVNLEDDDWEIYRDFRDKGGGLLLIHKGYTKERRKPDFFKVRRSGEEFARIGYNVKMAPEFHFKSKEYQKVFGFLNGTKYERKCPDLILNTTTAVEFEGYAPPFKKRKIGNMLNNGLKQAPNIVIDNTKGTTYRNIKRRIFNKSKQTEVKDVWVYEKGNLVKIK